MGGTQGELGEPSDIDTASVDVATAVAAKFFGNEISLRLPFWKAAAIDAQANFAQRIHGANLTIGNGGPIRDYNGVDEAEEKEERKRDQFRDFIQTIAEIEKQEREEWSRTTSTVGGVTMTGDEWSNLSNLITGDKKFYDDLIAAFRKRGLSEEEAEARAKRLAEIARIAAIPPSQRTPEDQHAIDDAQADPTFARDVQTAKEMREKRPDTLSDTYNAATTNSNLEPAAPIAAPDKTAIISLGL